MSIWIAILYALALLPYAVFFGISVFIFMAPCYDKLSGRAFVEYFQAIDPYMKVRAPVVGQLKLGLTIPLLVLQVREWDRPAFALTCFALLASLASAVIAVRGNVPLNRHMDGWSAESPPAEWAEVRRAWLKFHDWRGIAEIAAFLALLIAAMLPPREIAP